MSHDQTGFIRRAQVRTAIYHPLANDETRSIVNAAVAIAITRTVSLNGGDA